MNKKQSHAKTLSIATFVVLFMLAGCQSSHEAAKVHYQLISSEGSMIDVDKKWDTHPDAAAQAVLKPYKEEVDKTMYEVIGTSELFMDKGSPESLLSNLVAEVLRLAAIKVQATPADMAVINMGGLRNTLAKGEITVGAVYEILPFDNSLCVMTMKGTDMKRLCQGIAAGKGEGISGARLVISKAGKLLEATIGGEPIDDNKIYTVASIDYLADGNSGMDAFLQAVKRQCPQEATLRSLFLEYVREQTAAGKQITSSLDGRITVK